MLGCLRLLQSPHRIAKNKTNEKYSRCQTMHQPLFLSRLAILGRFYIFFQYGWVIQGFSYRLHCGSRSISWRSVSFPKVPNEKALCKFYLSSPLSGGKRASSMQFGALEAPAFISVQLCLPRGHAACFDSGSPQIVGISRACLDKLEIKAFSRQTARCSYRVSSCLLLSSPNNCRFTVAITATGYVTYISTKLKAAKRSLCKSQC